MSMIHCIPFFKSDISWFAIISTTLIPVILFLSGYWLSKIIDNKKERKRLNRLKKYFIQLIKQLNLKLNKQIKVLKSGAEKQYDFSSPDLIIGIISGESHRLLKIINREELYEVLVLSFSGKIEVRAKQFDEILSCIDFICKVLDSLELYYPKIIDTYNRSAERWNKAIIEFYKIINSKRVRLNQNKQDKFYKELDLLFDNMNDSKGENRYIKNIDIAHKKFIDPLKKLIIKFERDDFIDLLNEIEKLQVEYDEMKGLQENLKNTNLGISEKLENKRKEMIQLLNKIELLK